MPLLTYKRAELTEHAGAAHNSNCPNTHCFQRGAPFSWGPLLRLPGTPARRKEGAGRGGGGFSRPAAACPAASANPDPTMHWAGSWDRLGTRPAGQGAFHNSVPRSPARLAGVRQREGSTGRGVSEQLPLGTSGTCLVGSRGRAVHTERWRLVHVLPTPRACPAALTQGPRPWRAGLLQFPGRPSRDIPETEARLRRWAGSGGEGGPSQAGAQASRGAALGMRAPRCWAAPPTWGVWHARALTPLLPNHLRAPYEESIFEVRET